MPDTGMLYGLKVVAALGCGLAAGVFFAFSAFVMNALARLPPPQGIAAMQAINVSAVTAPFMLAFMGTAALCLGLGGYGAATLRQPGSAWLLAGGLLYLIGVFLVTAAGNVPMNDALAKLSPRDPATAEAWARYVSQWTALNHVRTAAALAAMTAFIVSLRR